MECFCGRVHKLCGLFPTQGIKAVIAESYERIHRSNLVGMGIVPLQYQAGETADSLGLTGKETYTIEMSDTPNMGELINVKVRYDVTFWCRTKTLAFVARVLSKVLGFCLMFLKLIFVF